MNSKRYFALDGIRGFTLLNMIAYHGIWDLVYLFNFNWQWFRSEAAWFWQQGICFTFILLSGFCQPLGNNRLKRGLLVFFLGLAVSMVTILFTPESRVLFGVLTLLGSCMLLTLPLEKFLQKANPIAGFFISAGLFILTRSINQGFLGLGSFRLLSLPRLLYQNLATAYLGFPPDSFYSADYFSLFPWFFLFLSGYFLHGCLKEKNLLHRLAPSRCRPLEWLGRRSLLLYLLHQPLLYVLFLVFIPKEG